MPKPQVIPVGEEYTRNVFRFASATKSVSDADADPSHPSFVSIGNSLSALYQIGTCTPECRGGPHILEAIAARAHNHGCGSLILLSVALYDESLNLTRSIAEIANLLFLFRINPEEYRAWVRATRNARLRNFGPSSIRKKIQDLNAPLPISAEWYQELCEGATHPVPEMRPNAHEPDGVFPGFVGGLFQEKGYSNCVFQLNYVLATAAVAVASMFERQDLIELVESALDTEIEHWKSQSGHQAVSDGEEPEAS